MIFHSAAMGRVMACAGSYMLQQGKPNPSRIEATEGTDAHRYAAGILLGTSALESIPSPEMQTAVGRYVDVCQAMQCGGVEVKHDMEDGDNELRGTPDFYSWGFDNILRVADLKYGYGWVEAEENWQLLCYAVLIWIAAGGYMPVGVEIIIVQPRANHPGGPVRKWYFAGELIRNYYNQIRGAMAAAAIPGAVTHAGEHCRYCRAIVDCHTNRDSVYNCIDVAGRATESELAGDELAYELGLISSAQRLITQRAVALEAYATERIKTGHPVPGYEVRSGMGSLSWDVPDPIAAGIEFDVDLAAPAVAVTPTQAIARKIITQEQAGWMASRKAKAPSLRKVNLKLAKELIKNAG